MKFMITPEEIRYFKAICSSGNITRAAERLGLTQPALSHAMKRLETDLGCNLFIRNKSGVSLTRAGKKLEGLVSELEMNWSRIKGLVSDEMHLLEGTYTIGCHPAVGLSTLHRFMGPLLKKHPRLNIQLQHGLSREISEALITDKLDLGLIANPVKHPDLVLHELTSERFALWRSSDLINNDVLIFDPDLGQVQKLIASCARKGIVFKRHIHSSSLEVTAKMTSEGVGVGILPERVLMELSNTKCKAIPNMPTIKDSVCVVYKKSSPMTEARAVILQAIRDARY